MRGFRESLGQVYVEHEPNCIHQCRLNICKDKGLPMPHTH